MFKPKIHVKTWKYSISQRTVVATIEYKGTHRQRNVEAHKYGFIRMLYKRM